MNESVICFQCGKIHNEKREYCIRCKVRLTLTSLLDADEVIIPEHECIVLKERLKAIRDTIDKNLLTSRFDANQFLKVFDRIKLKEGYILDYVYLSGLLTGYPVLFTRKLTTDPMSISDEIKNLHGRGSLIKDIEFEHSHLGFFQFAVFSIAVHQFYLVQHGCYNDLIFIFTNYELKKPLILYHWSLKKKRFLF